MTGTRVPRTGRAGKPARAGKPGRPDKRGRPDKLSRPDRRSRSDRAPRVPFALLVTALIVGGLALLLALNTASAANELDRHDIATRDARIAAQVQQLRNEVAASAAPGNLAQAAAALGMVPDGGPAFLVQRSDGTLQLRGKPEIATAAPLVAAAASAPHQAPKHSASPSSSASRSASRSASSSPSRSATSSATRTSSRSASRSSSRSATRSGTASHSAPKPTPTPTPTVTLPGGAK